MRSSKPCSRSCGNWKTQQGRYWLPVCWTCRLLQADADMEAQLNPPSPEHFLADINSAVLS